MNKTVAIEGILLDVGGTLWPDRWTEQDDDRDTMIARLTALAAGLDHQRAGALIDQLDAACSTVADGGPQPTTTTIAEVVEQTGLTEELNDPMAICAALSLPFARGHKLLPGAADMVRRLHADGLRIVVISNTVFRNATCYWEDFADAGLDGCLAGIVTSLDVGWRKPHPAIFSAALDMLAMPADRAAIVGNSETSDVAPARALGMRTVRVAIEEPRPTDSQADAVVTSLDDVADALR
jgi:putative hydrolase of the HAD superfamily